MGKNMAWIDKTLYWGRYDSKTPTELSPTEKRIVRMPFSKVQLAIGAIDTPGGYKQVCRDDPNYRYSSRWIKVCVWVIDLYWQLKVGRG
jgi:hypothetical protein